MTSLGKLFEGMSAPEPIVGKVQTTLVLETNALDIFLKDLVEALKKLNVEVENAKGKNETLEKQLADSKAASEKEINALRDDLKALREQTDKDKAEQQQQNKSILAKLQSFKDTEVASTSDANSRPQTSEEPKKPPSPVAEDGVAEPDAGTKSPKTGSPRSESPNSDTEPSAAAEQKRAESSGERSAREGGADAAVELAKLRQEMEEGLEKGAKETAEVRARQEELREKQEELKGLHDMLDKVSPSLRARPHNPPKGRPTLCNTRAHTFVLLTGEGGLRAWQAHGRRWQRCR